MLCNGMISQGWCSDEWDRTEGGLQLMQDTAVSSGGIHVSGTARVACKQAISPIVKCLV